MLLRTAARFAMICLLQVASVCPDVSFRERRMCFQKETSKRMVRTVKKARWLAPAMLLFVDAFLTRRHFSRSAVQDLSRSKQVAQLLLDVLRLCVGGNASHNNTHTLKLDRTQMVWRQPLVFYFARAVKKYEMLCPNRPPDKESLLASHPL